jgi:hypothetical protein
LSADELGRRLEEKAFRLGLAFTRYAASPASRATVIETWSRHATSLFATALQGLRLFAELGPDHECSQSEAAMQCWDFVARGLMVESGGCLDPFNRVVYDYMIVCGAPLPCNFTTARRRLYLLRRRVRQTLNADAKLAAGRRLRIFERFMLSISAEFAQRRFQKRRPTIDFAAVGARR